MSDLQQISLCLKQISGRSLVLIDEFGKGTNESGESQRFNTRHSAILLECSLSLLDGIGLACGVLEYLLNMKDAPKVIAATHFHEIFENSFLAPRPRLQLGHMEVKVSGDSQEAEDQVTYLYKYLSPRPFLQSGILHEGLIGMQLSLGPQQQELWHHVSRFFLFLSHSVTNYLSTRCAAINGIDAAIVTRADEIASLAARGENLIAACAILSTEESKCLQHAV